MTPDQQRIAAYIGPTARATPDLARPGEYTCESGRFQIPIVYKGVRTWIGAFPAALDRVQALLPRGVAAQKFEGDRGLFVVQFVDMPNTTIGSYREVGMGIPVRKMSGAPPTPSDAIWSPPPVYIVWLPVTSRLARDSGQAIWGYPKTVAEVEFETQQDRFCGRLLLDGKLLLEVDASIAGTPESGVIHMRSVTEIGTRLAQTRITAPATITQYSQFEPCLDIHPGSAVTDVLCQLGVETRPVASTFVCDFDYELTAPDIGSAP